MAWNDPNEAEWEVGDILTSDSLKDYVRDNLLALKDPPSAIYDADETTNLSLSSTSWIDLTGFEETISTNGGLVMVCLRLSFGVSADCVVFFDITVDNNPEGGNEGLVGKISNATTTRAVEGNVMLVHWVEGLSAGSHTFRVRAKTSAGTVTLYRGAGTSDADVIGQFVVREVS